jgi:Zn-dependent peptidase ImmA (M78 family)
MHNLITKAAIITRESETEQPSVLASLRSLFPERRLQFFEALRITELQANRHLELSGVHSAPVPSEIVTDLPRITVEYDIDMPCSGSSDWDSRRRTWVITLNALEPDTRHRFSLLHEYKHIIDHGSPGLVDLGSFRYFGREPDEYIADYFAACVLMPKRLVKRAWGEGTQRLSDLAEAFDVSLQAMEVRLTQLGLVEPRTRCAQLATRPASAARRGRYHRSFPIHWPGSHLPQEVAV